MSKICMSIIIGVMMLGCSSKDVNVNKNIDLSKTFVIYESADKIAKYHVANGKMYENGKELGKVIKVPIVDGAVVLVDEYGSGYEDFKFLKKNGSTKFVEYLLGENTAMKRYEYYSPNGICNALDSGDTVGVKIYHTEYMKDFDEPVSASYLFTSISKTKKSDTIMGLYYINPKIAGKFSKETLLQALQESMILNFTFSASAVASNLGCNTNLNKFKEQK